MRQGSTWLLALLVACAELKQADGTPPSTPEVIASNVDMTPYQNLALDESYLYWITDQGVFRRRK